LLYKNEMNLNLKKKTHTHNTITLFEQFFLFITTQTRNKVTTKIKKQINRG